MRLHELCNQTEATVMCLSWFWGVYCLPKVFEQLQVAPKTFRCAGCFLVTIGRRFWRGRDGFRASFTYDHSGCLQGVCPGFDVANTRW